VTLGWAAECSNLQDELKVHPPPSVPALFLCTDGDLVLDGQELARLSKYASAEVTLRLVEHCRHDLLLNHSKEKNEEVLEIILGWLAARGVGK